MNKQFLELVKELIFQIEFLSSNVVLRDFDVMLKFNEIFHKASILHLQIHYMSLYNILFI